MFTGNKKSETHKFALFWVRVKGILVREQLARHKCYVQPLQLPSLLLKPHKSISFDSLIFIAGVSIMKPYDVLLKLRQDI